jgi:hypothetical protein
LAVAFAITKKTTLIAMRAIVTTEDPSLSLPPKAVRARGAVADPCRTHSGHWNPTDACVMQSGQIGRAQR